MSFLTKLWLQMASDCNIILKRNKLSFQPSCMGENLSHSQNAKLSIRVFFTVLPQSFTRSRWTWAFPAHSKLSFACTHFTHSLVALRVGETDGGCSELHQDKVFSAPELYQDTFPPLLLKTFFEVTAKQSWSNASATTLREEPGCQKSWMWGSDSGPNTVMKGALHTKAARTIKNLLACPLCSFTSFIIPTDSLLQN